MVGMKYCHQTKS